MRHVFETMGTAASIELHAPGADCVISRDRAAVRGSHIACPKGDDAARRMQHSNRVCGIRDRVSRAVAWRVEQLAREVGGIAVTAPFEASWTLDARARSGLDRGGFTDDPRSLTWR